LVAMGVGWPPPPPPEPAPSAGQLGRVNAL
jgi:hypothetical protein